MESPRKRSRQDETMSDDGLTLTTLLELRRWDSAMEVIRKDPSLVSVFSPDPVPLAVACRHGAPYECVQEILTLHPASLRRVLDSRGTPLHEAIVCETVGVEVISLLLQTDTELGTATTPACLLQDVDGFTPLHLLIRRRFQSYMLQSGQENNTLMQILEMLVRSCPDAVVIPDRGEYEEPPIVYAIKANMYAPSLSSEAATTERVERQIFEMVDCMLRYNPSAASRVFSGYRGQYTALHSAVFHGRYTDTIELILRAESQTVSPNNSQASLLQNTQGEIPLHFCAMRGERPRTVELIARAAPRGVLKRDTSGLTPFHWIWIRFISTLLTLEEGGRGVDASISIPLNSRRRVEGWSSAYKYFSVMEQGDFNADLPLIQRMDPPLEFLRMRHIPEEVLEYEKCLHKAGLAAEVLKRMRTRYNNTINEELIEMQEFSREEVVTSLFWTKLVDFLEAANEASPSLLRGTSTLLHIAFATKSCPPAVAQMIASVFPEDLMLPDDEGHLPLHCAASRPWDQWDWPSVSNDLASAVLLQKDSIRAFKVGLSVSPKEALRVADGKGRLVLHHLIESFTVASGFCRERQPDLEVDVLDVIEQVVRLYPDALLQPDGGPHCKTRGLIPFLQASAVETRRECNGFPEELSLSMAFCLLRENPTVLTSSFKN